MNDKYAGLSIDFETMTVYYEGKPTNPLLKIQWLNEMAYWGNFSIEEQVGYIPSRPGSWSYYCGSIERSKRAWDDYVTWQLEKAFQFEEI